MTHALLDETYPDFLLKETERKSGTHLTSATISIRESAGEALDLGSVTKASQVISSEIVLETLLNKMMNVLIENAGAQTGFLLLDNQGQWRIEAEKFIDTDEVVVLQSIPIDTEEKDNLPGGSLFYEVHFCQ